ncbi:hypothetical protein K458DRAFT_386385 [Lentithecium fluviatile CBS 122367]|uniref:Uncharacterized protein n=1 Tax=Lentithecium fluviatile CBS 122367 TaxID=1168545 RepID=A0A6G1JAL3_9PLEO|nr:hypothetical protein K458DRAFT_386385 [Lentithecium fluviatile CBS 122367]
MRSGNEQKVTPVIMFLAVIPSAPSLGIQPPASWLDRELHKQHDAHSWKLGSGTFGSMNFWWHTILAVSAELLAAADEYDYYMQQARRNRAKGTPDSTIPALQHASMYALGHAVHGLQRSSLELGHDYSIDEYAMTLLETRFRIRASTFQNPHPQYRTHDIASTRQPVIVSSVEARMSDKKLGGTLTAGETMMPLKYGVELEFLFFSKELVERVQELLSKEEKKADLLIKMTRCSQKIKLMLMRYSKREHLLARNLRKRGSLVKFPFGKLNKKRIIKNDYTKSTVKYEDYADPESWPEENKQLTFSFEVIEKTMSIKDLCELMSTEPNPTKKFPHCKFQWNFLHILPKGKEYGFKEDPNGTIKFRQAAGSKIASCVIGWGLFVLGFVQLYK